ncbi:selenocysteine lyase/cysteine desulfurase [Nocardioides sp. J9]|uniref:hypothetical protein n=1 Tax=Nocardioides sp. J9 TaxID=935844 RepID=UPI0011AD2F1F|nr:hypothetical protein [Nocardioides sp. J9]TWG96809.1 selenocysteine lyase/cysteine desulfurase [Nocardioides sp. J9]
MIAPAELAAHYSRFRVCERLLLTGHSHQAWPDVARDAVIEAWDDAASEVDRKWERAAAKGDRLRAGVRTLLDDPGSEVALAASTHDLVVRFLSALDLGRRPRLVTTDGEFHSARRQLARLAEAGLDVVRVPAGPVESLAERLAAEVDDRTAAVVVSSVLFETSRLVPGLDQLAAACERRGAELLVDAYHQLGVVPLSLPRAGLAEAWVVGGGYKYLQLGEGNCFLRVPPHAAGLRPVVTGWYAEFGDLAGAPPGGVAYAAGAAFAGATYDPTSHYRAARALDFFDEHGLTPEALRERSLHQRGLLVEAFDELDLPDDLATRDREAPAEAFGGFLAVLSDRAAQLQEGLAAAGVHTDSRSRHLRFGPAPYVTDEQLRAAMTALGEVARRLG